MDRSHKRDDVAAIFPDRPHATAAIEDLCAADADLHLRVAAEAGEQRIYELDADGILGRSLRMGVMVGMPLGALFGIVLVALAANGTGATWVEILAVGGGAGLLAGALFGGFTGMLRSVWLQDDVDDWAELRLDDDEVLVVARGNGHAEQVRGMLERHGGRPVAHA